MPAVVLENPKFPFNVGSALRACSVFGVPYMRWTGERVREPRDGDRIGKATKKYNGRLPRDERMKRYRDVDWCQDDHALQKFVDLGLVPVCVEIGVGAQSLVDFEHPMNAVYVFGPEDASVSKGNRAFCHRFVEIPSFSCLNLAAAVNVVLYDRIAKTIPAVRELIEAHDL